MKKLYRRANELAISARNLMTMKRDGVDQIIVIFIIIAVAAGIAGLIYMFGTQTLLPNFQDKVTNLINGWFDHA